MNKDQRYQEWADLNGVNHPDPEVRDGFKQIKAEDAFKRGYECGRADAMSWRPIESAPKDGSEVWAFNGEQARMKWVSGDGYALWIWADEDLADIDPSPAQPTHWREIPEEPK